MAQVDPLCLPIMKYHKSQHHSSYCMDVMLSTAECIERVLESQPMWRWWCCVLCGINSSKADEDDRAGSEESLTTSEISKT